MHQPVVRQRSGVRVVESEVVVTDADRAICGNCGKLQIELRRTRALPAIFILQSDDVIDLRG